MATRQYIGARYVPKFYTNTVDGSTQWQANVVYEPLMYVTLINGHMYISKKQVPATVGSPAENIDYWLDIGSYNGMIEDLQNQIDALVEEVNETAEDVEGVKSATVTFNPYFRPEDYGAVINDPAVDCAPAIKQAILAANAAQGGKVLLSTGIYYCTTPIRISEHLYCVDIIGAGSTYNSSTALVKGSSINYSGSGTFLHFANGTWKCNFKDFGIWSTGSGGATLRFSYDDDPSSIARATNNLLDNVCVSFQHHGLELNNAAYFVMNRCVFRHVSRLDDTTNTDTNPVGVVVQTNNEYVTMRDCTIVPNQINSFTGTSWSRGLMVTNVRHFNISNLDITDCDEGILLAPAASGDNCDFIYADSINVARVHIGLLGRPNNMPINDVIIDQFIFTSEESLHANNRVLKFEKTAGGQNYAFRGRIHNIAIRTGANEMTYWVRADANSLAPGVCDFTFCSHLMPKVTYGDTRATNNTNFSTMTYDTPHTVDLNDYKYAGVMPFLAAADSTHSVGHPAMIVNFVNQQATIQVALPTSPGYSIMYRVYQSSSDAWGSWKTLSQT